MSDLRISMHIKFADGQDAANLEVHVVEDGVTTYNVGKTGLDGTIDAAVRRRHQVVGANGQMHDDPNDLPALTVVISDRAGHQAQTALVPEFVLPLVFDPSQCANQALVDPASGLAGNAPGYVYLVRKNGKVWANATAGLARVAINGAVQERMTNDTIVHLASMSKPITNTALVAMIDDWSEIAHGVARLGAAGSPTQTVQVGPDAVVVPKILVPIFSSRAFARNFLLHHAASLPLAAPVLSALDAFANHGAAVQPPPPAPPGYFGLLTKVLLGVAVPRFSDPFVPLIVDHLGAGATIGVGTAQITLADLLTFGNDLGNNLDPNQHPAATIAALAPTQPAGGPAQFNYWPYVRLLVSEDHRRGPFNYGNNGHTVLSTVIEACTGTTFNDYVVQRLFSDPHFKLIRRFVADRNADAFYYRGSSPNWTGGVRLSDYTNWSGNGGFYATASQLTEWLYVLYKRLPVRQVDRRAPLVSDVGQSLLFEKAGFFTLGRREYDSVPDIHFRFQENGGTTVNGGSVNGNLAVIVTNSGNVYTAFYDANGAAGADPPFDAAARRLPWA